MGLSLSDLKSHAEPAAYLTGGPEYSRDEPGRCPCTGQAVPGVEGGVILVCGSCTEHEKAGVDTAGRSLGRRPPGWREGAWRGSNHSHGVPMRCPLADRSVVAGRPLLAGVAVEPRDRLTLPCRVEQLGGSPGGSEQA